MTDYTMIEEGNRHEMATDPAYAEAPTRSATTPMITLALVADNRLTTAPTRPMPSTGHNIDFARQELAELLDAHETRPVGTYERNTDKDHSARRELAQTIHQIGSALLTIDDDTPPAQVDPWIDMQIQIDFLLASARSEWNKGRKAQAVELLDLALVRSCDLAELMGLDPVAIVVDENARIVAKEEKKGVDLVQSGGTIGQALPRRAKICNCGDTFTGPGDLCALCADDPRGGTWWRASLPYLDEHNIRPGETTFGTIAAMLDPDTPGATP